MKPMELVAKSEKQAEVILYGDVAWWNALNALSLYKVIRAAEKASYDQLVFKILNSPGGSIFEGVAMNSVLSETHLETICRIESLAASMASAISASCDRSKMSKGGRLMIHQGSGGAFGTSKQMITRGKLLASLNEDIASIYAAKSGRDEQWILDNWMAENTDTWFKASEAKSEKLIDEVFGNKVKPIKEAEDAEAHYDFDQMVAHYNGEIERIQIQTASNSNSNSSMFTKEKFPKLVAMIGSDSITDDAIAAVNTELQEQKLEGVIVVGASAQEALTQQAKKDEDKVKALAASLEAVMKKLNPEHTGEASQDAITGSIDGLQTQLAAANTRLKELGEEPGATHTQTQKPSGDNLDDVDDPNAEIAKLPHNAALDNNPLFNHFETTD